MTKNELELARIAKNKYQREWRKKNPERAKKHKLDFFLKLGKEMAEQEGGKNGK